MKPIVVGIDPSLTATGWCVWDADCPSSGYLGSGTVHGPAADRADRDPDETQDVLIRLTAIEDKLRYAIKPILARRFAGGVRYDYRRSVVYVVEADLQSGTRRGQRPYNTMHKYHFACGYLARALGPLRLVDPMSWKGNASKADAILLASDLIGRKLTTKDHDEADAICIAHHEVSRLRTTTQP